MEKDTEQIILSTAREHFVQHGFAGARMQKIADEAGINKALLHYYFRSKEKLYHRIVQQTLDYIFPRLAEAMGTEDAFQNRLEKFVETYVTTLLAQPHIPFFIMSELSQKREQFIEELKKRAVFFPAVQSFMLQMHQEMQDGIIRSMPPIQLLLSIMSLTVFPFIAKPIFCTVLDMSESDFEDLMVERKTFILEFLSHALHV